ncbi:MAG: DUF4157 domain-containing protein [Streptosporangiaceae bacterium]
MLRSPGRPLAEPTLAFMEPRFGRDFSHVRVHTDARAAESARHINSLAYTVGNRVVVGSGDHAPDTESGRRLLAHELAHVVQQGPGGGPAGVIRRAPGKGGTGDEPPKELKTPLRVPYGSTPISKKAIEYRRNNPGISGDQNLIVVEFSWRKTDGTAPPQDKTEYIWNRPDVGHSEPVLDQYFRDFKKANGKNVEVKVKEIFSERQFCGPSSKDCEWLIYGSYPEAKKEFAYNYQMPPGAREGEGPTTRNVVKGRIERFRDSGQDVDTSTRRDPPPYSERAGGRLPGQVAPPPKPAGGESAAQVPAKPAAPATPTAQTPAKPSAAEPPTPKPPVSKPATPKPSAAEPPTPKPPVSKPATPKPTTPKPSASKPSKTPPSGDVSGPHTEGGHGGSKTTALTEHMGNVAAGAVLGETMSQLKAMADKSGDKDLATGIDMLNKGMDANSFLENPEGFIAGKIKEDLIQAVFDHFAKSLNAAYQSFEQKFPDVSTLEKDPLGNGLSLEAYRINYEKALLALRIPDERRVLVYTLMNANLPEGAPKEEVERRIAAANEYLANLPGLDVYYRKYGEASVLYGWALFAVENQLLIRGDEWAEQPAGLSDDLRRRSEALDKVANILDDAGNQLWNSGAVVFDPVASLWLDLNTLSKGFEGLGNGLREFADEVGRRKGEYDRELTRLQVEVDNKAAQPF